MAENDQPQGEKPKIIIDDDWKAQARAEKERLAKETESKTAEARGQAAAAGAETPGAPGGPRELPEASFTSLVNQIATQVILALGGVEDPRTGRRYVDLGLAKYHIDTLSVLEEKTRGNLSDEEKKLLDTALYETRMQYVAMAQRISQAARPGAEDGGAAGPGGTPPAPGGEGSIQT